MSQPSPEQWRLQHSRRNFRFFLHSYESERWGASLRLLSAKYTCTIKFKHSEHNQILTWSRVKSIKLWKSTVNENRFFTHSPQNRQRFSEDDAMAQVFSTQTNAALFVWRRIDEEAVFVVESVVRGYHVYHAIWEAVVSEELLCNAEAGNCSDRFAVAVVKNPTTVSAPCAIFLKKDGYSSDRSTSWRWTRAVRTLH